MAHGLFFHHGSSAANLHDKPGHMPRWRNVMFARFRPWDHAIKEMLAATGQNKMPGFADRFDNDDLADFELYSRIVRVSGPEVRPNVVKLNQYNRKKAVVTDYDYGDISLEWRDTADSAALAFWDLYYAFMFKQARGYRNAGEYDDGKAFGKEQFDDYGISLARKPRNPNFFKRLEIYHFGAGRFTRTDIVNPEVTGFSQTELAYEDGNTLAAHAMTVMPENVTRVHLATGILEPNPAHPAGATPHGDVDGILREEVGGRIYGVTDEHIKAALDYADSLSPNSQINAEDDGRRGANAGAGGNPPPPRNGADYEEYPGGFSLNFGTFSSRPDSPDSVIANRNSFSAPEGASGYFRRTINGVTHIWSYGAGGVNYNHWSAYPGEEAPDSYALSIGSDGGAPGAAANAIRQGA